MRTRLHWTIAGFLPLAACSTALQTATQPRFEPLAECFAQPPADLPVQFSMECGYVLVPEFHHGASTRELRLGVTRLNSGQGNAKSPLFMLAGGPGQSQISPTFLRLFQPTLLGGILKARDIVIIEQRGTEYTDTHLDCPEAAAAQWAVYEQGLTGQAADTFAANVLRACIDKFVAQGVNLDAYNSVDNAADVNAVREALGYDKIIYYGGSYGSQLGQHVMRDFPRILEGVVLDGAEALSRRSWVEYRGLNAQWGIDNLTALCEADAKCAAAYDIPALVDRALALFDNGPRPYSYTDPSDPSLTVKGEITVLDMAQVINEMLSSHYGVYALPAFLTQLTTGNAQQVENTMGPMVGGQLIASRNPGPSPMAILMHFAMICSEDPVRSVNDVKLDGVGRFARLAVENSAEEYAQACSIIDVRELPASVHVDVTTNVPVLLLSGSLDVATPSFRSQEVEDALPNAKLIVFPGTTHVQIASVNRCAGRVMTQFVLEPTATLDTGCAAPTPLTFVLPDGSSSRE